MVENLERAARALLWLTLSGVLVLGLVGLGELQKAQERAALEAAKQAEAIMKAAPGKAEPPAQLELESLGMRFSGINMEKAAGRVIFSNASSRHGAVCVKAIATSKADPSKSTESIAACRVVEPYESAVVLEAQFAGRNLAEVCPEPGACTLEVANVPAP